MSLKNSEIIDDLFNNYNDPSDKKKDSRVRLSNTTKVIYARIREEVKKLLVDKQMAKAINNIPIPENSYTLKAKDSALHMRKLYSYYSWLNINKNLEEPFVTQDSQPFMELQALQKDKEIISIYENIESYHQVLQENRQKNTPNYYYNMYPEAYSFN